MILNAVIALILCFYSPNSTDFQADYITVVEDRPTNYNVHKILPPSSRHPLLIVIRRQARVMATHAAAGPSTSEAHAQIQYSFGLSVIAEHLV